MLNMNPPWVSNYQTYLADTNDIEARFYLGMAYLENDQFAEAKTTLSQEIKNQPYAEWNLALFALKNNQLSEAQSRLQAIADQEGHFFQKKAQALLEEWNP